MCQKVTIFNFSPRSGANCAKIANFISNYHGESNAVIYHITAENCPSCGGCNYECLTPGAQCPSKPDLLIRGLDDACASDLIYYIIPNFCGYPNANYFAFNERCVGYFGMDRQLRAGYMKIRKKFIIVSNTENDNFKNAAQQQTAAEPEMLYLKTGKYHKRSTAGDLMESDEAKADLQAFLNM